jgi:CubicO group peptidase (beta-lactamase class C family)
MLIEPSLVETLVHQHTTATPFSGVVGVYECGYAIFEHAYGLANRSEALPNTLATRFGTASGSKTFTAVAICQLVARGVLAFDTPLAACTPVPFPSFDPGVTIHHLLTHTSGIPDYFDEAIMDDFAALWYDLPVYRLRSPADFLPLFQARPMQFAPGTRFHYNNAGFVVLALVVEHMTGMPFHHYVTEHVFQAGGMVDSGYFTTDQLPARTALGYIEDAPGTEWRTNIFAVPVIGGGDGGAYTTVADVITFWRGLHNNVFFPSETSHTLLTPHVQVHDQVFYGYGNWITVDSNGSPYKYVLAGSDPGVTFYTSSYPERDVQIVALGNTSHGASALAKAIEHLAGINVSE